MKDGRSAALICLNRCFTSGAWSSQVLSSEVKDLDPRESSLASFLFLIVLQNSTLLDYYIDYYVSKPEKLENHVRNILRLGAAQIIFSAKIPVSAAVNESVKLCRKNGYSSACGLVNAVLHRIADAYQNNNLPEINGSPSQILSIRYSHPLWFVERLISDHGFDFAEAFLKADNTESEICYHSAFADGEKYVQDNAAYQAVLMADPLPEMKVLDACAAPGGKSFTAAVLMKNSGEIISCDIHKKKLSLIRNGAERLGIGIISTFECDASVYHEQFREKFDIVIADVPCSGFGVIRKKPEIRFKSQADISRLPEIQLNILKNVSAYLKPGGILLYSTCTVFSEENECVVREFLNSFHVFKLEKEKTFYPNIDGTDGFYAAVLKKSGNI